MVEEAAEPSASRDVHSKRRSKNKLFNNNRFWFAGA